MKKLLPCLYCDVKFKTTAEVRICARCKQYGWAKLAQDCYFPEYKVIAYKNRGKLE